MKKIKAILQLYHLQDAEIIRVHPNLYQVIKDNRAYALKKSHHLFHNHEFFLFVYERLPHGVLPLYVTRTGSALVRDQEVMYYLTPWLKQAPFELEAYFHALGTVHQATKEEQPLNQERVIEMFRTYGKHVETYEQQLLSALEKCESSVYMSPFELLICMQYHQVEFVLQEHRYWLRKVQRLAEKENSWSTSIIHGSPRKKYFYNGERFYFVNWERSRTDHATTDLVYFVKSEMASYYNYSNIDQYKKAFDSYLRVYPMTELETAYFILQLLDPAEYLECIEQHLKKHSENISMIEATEQLTNYFRNIKFGLYWSRSVRDAEVAQNQSTKKS